MFNQVPWLWACHSLVMITPVMEDVMVEMTNNNRIFININSSAPDSYDSSYPCQCNTACSSHSDCCDDYTSVCQQSCRGRCGYVLSIQISAWGVDKWKIRVNEDWGISTENFSIWGARLEFSWWGRSPSIPPPIFDKTDPILWLSLLQS